MVRAELHLVSIVSSIFCTDCQRNGSCRTLLMVECFMCRRRLYNGSIFFAEIADSR